MTALFRRINSEIPRRRARRARPARILGRPTFAAPFILLSLPLFASAPARAETLPDASDVMRCYQAVEARVRAFGQGDASIPDPENATGACVTLRLGGRVIGRATSLEVKSGNVGRALEEAWKKASGALIVEKDALADEHRHALAGRITVDLEISGSLLPLVGATFEAASSRLSPGIDGVAMREGDRIVGVFPATQLATGILPDRALRVAAGKLDLPPTELDRIRRDHQVTLYSFRTQHLAQTRPDDPPQFLQRGGTYVPLADVTGAHLRATADAIAAHLLTHRWTGPEAYGLRGDYHPTTGMYEPLVGDPLPQGLVAFALARYAQTPGVDPDTAKRSVELARKVLHDLTVVEADESNPTSDPVASAMWLAAWAELTGADPAVGQDSNLTAFLKLALNALHKGLDSRESWTKLEPGAKALVAYGLIRAGEAGIDPDAPKRAQTILGELLAGSTSAHLASLMPWVAWAELELAPEGRVPAGLALRDFRSLVWQFQVEESPAESADADLSGGIVFTRGGARLPTWQTLRPLAALASMLGNASLTSGQDLGLELASVRRSLRFLMQLTVRDGELSMMQSERRSAGGVRLALWDQTEGLDANATGLLSVCETLRSIAARSRNPNEGASH